MKKNREGSSMVVAIIVLVVVAAGALYFFSPMFKTRVDETVRQQTEWTNENIQADPVGYLTWAAAKCRKTETKLLSSELGLKTQRNELTRKMAEKQDELEKYSELLGEAKDVYRAAVEKSEWPAVLRSVSMDQVKLKQRIVEANDKVKALTDLIATYAGAEKKVTSQYAQLGEQLSDLKKMQTKLATDLEVAKVNKSVEGLGSINDQLSAIMDTANALADQQEVGGIEDLVMPDATLRIDEEFDKIMGE